MFGDMASDALGKSDICEVVDPSDYSDTVADAFILKEDGEEICFLLKSKEDEYCFTNYALLQVEGESATSGEQTLLRHDYYENHISNVRLETAGTADSDVELTFNIGGVSMEIDVTEEDLPKLAPLYKALTNLSKVMKERKQKHEDRHTSLEKASSLIKARSKKNYSSENGEARSDAFKEMHSYIHDWLDETHEEFWEEDFGYVFEKYIQ